MIWNKKHEKIKLSLKLWKLSIMSAYVTALKYSVKVKYHYNIFRAAKNLVLPVY